MNCGLAYKCRICLILVCPDVLGWEMTRASQKKGLVGSSLLLHICFLRMDPRCRSQKHLHHVTFKVTSAYTSCPYHEGQKVKVECKNSGVSLLFEAPQCKHRIVPRSSALSRGRLEPAALKPLWDHKMHKTHVRTIIYEFHINTESCSLLWVLSTKSEVTNQWNSNTNSFVSEAQGLSSLFVVDYWGLFFLCFFIILHYFDCLRKTGKERCNRNTEITKKKKIFTIYSK